MIVAATSQAPYNLATKLTGAGGGGCAVTLIPDGALQVEKNVALTSRISRIIA